MQRLLVLLLCLTSVAPGCAYSSLRNVLGRGSYDDDRWVMRPYGGTEVTFDIASRLRENDSADTAIAWVVISGPACIAVDTIFLPVTIPVSVIRNLKGEELPSLDLVETHSLWILFPPT